MAISYKLPKVQDVDQVAILDTPLAADTALANGVLTIKNEAGSAAIVVKAADLLSFRQTDYSAGTANIVDVQLSGVTMVNNTEYVLTVNAPYVQNFFGGGKETGATYQTRTYVVPTDASATAAELATAFVARITADANAYFTAAVVSSTTVRITAKSASAGALVVVAPTGSSISDNTAWVSPSGSVAEVLSYINNPALVVAAGYSRYIISYRKMIRHNAVTGLQVCKPVNSLVYLDKDNAGTSAAVTLLTSILNGYYGTSYATLAKYCGCPAV